MRFCRILTACVLVAVLLGLSGVAAAHVAAHAIQHQHHHADTHGTTICAWLCIAGQSAEAPPALVEPAIRQLEAAPAAAPPQPDVPTTTFLAPRGPPRPLLA